MKIGVILEGKIPQDKRVPLSPKQCKEVMDKFPGTEVVVQSSNVRAFKDEEYVSEGIEVKTDVSDCDVLLGVKEVNKEDLIANKIYLFFSHTIKKQEYNRDLLRVILEKNIQLIDYETLTNKNGGRLIGFGRYAGIIGCYNGFLAYGKKSKKYNLKPANLCADRKEMESELNKVALPKNFKIAITGLGRVATGAIEILDLLNIKAVSSEEYLSNEFDIPVYTQLTVHDYNKRIDGSEFSREDFYQDPTGYYSIFPKYASVTDMFVSCHYWDARSPYLFTREDIKSKNWKTNIVADISCDIDGPVASTIRPSTISNPLYGYNPSTESEADFMDEDAIGVMVVDNLPCELPRDASEDFGRELIDKILPNIIGEDTDTIIERASMTKGGSLTKYFSYLQGYVDGVN